MKCSLCTTDIDINWGGGRATLCKHCADTPEAKDLIEGNADQSSFLAKSANKRECNDSSHSPLSIVFFVLAGLSLIGGLILCGQLWPGDAGYGSQWKTIAYTPSITWLTVGVVQFALLTAVGQGLHYLRQIVSNTSNRNAA